jgi:hypothetical protein
VHPLGVAVEALLELLVDSIRTTMVATPRASSKRFNAELSARSRM